MKLGETCGPSSFASKKLSMPIEELGPLEGALFENFMQITKNI
jgi:hypothetical protein